MGMMIDISIGQVSSFLFLSKIYPFILARRPLHSRLYEPLGRKCGKTRPFTQKVHNASKIMDDLRVLTTRIIASLYGNIRTLHSRDIRF